MTFRENMRNCRFDQICNLPCTASPRARLESVKDFLCIDLLPGGREIVSRKRKITKKIVSKKRKTRRGKVIDI